MKYEGKIFFDGESILIRDKQALIVWLKQNVKKDSWLDFNIFSEVSNSDQRKLYGVWKDILAKELGWSSDELHEYFKKEFNNNKSTKGFDIQEWVTFMEKIKSFAGNRGISLPLGKE